MSESERPRGLYKKYNVSRTDRQPADGREYFVLCINADPSAAKAAMRYAECVETENPELAADLRAKLDETWTELQMERWAKEDALDAAVRERERLRTIWESADCGSGPGACRHDPECDVRLLTARMADLLDAGGTEGT